MGGLMQHQKAILSVLVGLATLVGIAFAAENRVYSIVDREIESKNAPIIIELKYQNKAIEQVIEVLQEINSELRNN